MFLKSTIHYYTWLYTKNTKLTNRHILCSVVLVSLLLHTLFLVPSYLESIPTSKCTLSNSPKYRSKSGMFLFIRGSPSQNFSLGFKIPLYSVNPCTMSFCVLTCPYQRVYLSFNHWQSFSIHWDVVALSVDWLYSSSVDTWNLSVEL